jgi:hypothetical protein
MEKEKGKKAFTMVKIFYIIAILICVSAKEIN